MEERNIFLNLSPLDHRYYLSNRKLFDGLSSYLSEEAAVRYTIRVEGALMLAHIDTHVDSSDGKKQKLITAVRNLEKTITPEEVDKEEQKTHHNIRALVNVIKQKVPHEIQHFVHLGATSADILDTANSLRIKDAMLNQVIPLLCEVEDILISLTEKDAETVQVGRTHGQYAVPITLGYALAEYVARLGKSITELKRLTNNLRGKLSGAVGAYNATSVAAPDPIEFERLCLSYLNLEPAEYATQVMEPEYVLRLLLEMNTAFGIIANLADDLRHLQRSEIQEVQEFFTSTQVGSSTMPQKRNPWNSEHVKSMWKAFSPRVMSFYMDQISEHQRDLSNSASSRFIIDYIAGFAAAAARIRKVLSTLHVNHKALERNMKNAGDSVLAEAAYILLSLGGESDAHEIIRQITLSCEREGLPMIEAIKRRKNTYSTIATMLKKITGFEADEFFSNPSMYTGRAAVKAQEIAATYKEIIGGIREDLPNE